jgi:hydroxyacyl-ACP dehydratase HTD2-like protein with hotdog domain
MSMMTSRSFESVRVADRIELTKGPLTEAHLMRWSSAMENWHRIHYDQQFAVAHERLPGLLISGSLKQQFIVQLLSRWAGRDGWLVSASFQFRSMNVAGEKLTAWASVSNLERQQDFGLVSFELGLKNDAGKESTPGQAVVALPFQT